MEPAAAKDKGSFRNYTVSTCGRPPLHPWLSRPWEGQQLSPCTAPGATLGIPRSHLVGPGLGEGGSGPLGVKGRGWRAAWLTRRLAVRPSPGPCLHHLQAYAHVADRGLRQEEGSCKTPNPNPARADPGATLTSPLLAQHAQFGSFSYKRMTVMEAVDMLDALVDESDPDVDFPNSFHAFQTAEGIRKAHPDKGVLPTRPGWWWERVEVRPSPSRPCPPPQPQGCPSTLAPAPPLACPAPLSPPDWFHLVGLLHDLGKVLALAGEPQWAVVGDTFPVGCRPQGSVLFCDSTFQDNPDLQDPRYSTELGMYQPHCGLENVLMSWGHDEYMYQMMKFNSFSLPPEVGVGEEPNQEPRPA
ncbi:inositol oxygenase isoform X2 [Physeter macrocephalus]|uniref:Inositol oxygenase n=1 Tax=Physeter macrocephalus TaxID=9755 RepID=A0A9W2WQK9_PHYMC|nr:inositol oxygenase isoform X2 [Physeter catodon]